MVRILLLGDITRPHYHSLQECSPLVEALREEFDVVVTENYVELTKEELKGFDLIMNYIDNWEDRGSEEVEELLCDYVSDGGRMLTLHCGIIVKSAARLLALHGASFRGHEDYSLLTFHRTKEHFITRDIDTFSIYEEPYEFDFINSGHLDMILEYERNHKIYPAGWTAMVGEGRLVYLVFGHDKNTFVEKPVQELVIKSIEWLFQ